MNQLRTDMHSYMEKDISNLNKVIESTMFNDNVINDKTNFIIDVLEEDEQIRVVNKEDIEISLANIESVVSLPDSDEWLKNITSVPEFRKLLSAS
jgi:ribose 5-phosphate isomerase